MKVTAFNGSPRPDGNTSIMIQAAFEPLRAAGIQTEVVQVGGRDIRGCRACYQCFSRKDGRCVFQDDIANECLARMASSDAIILASPTYFADLTSETKALIDRCGYVARANGDMLQRKVGAAVVAVRRAGAMHAFDSINHFFLIGQMIIPGSSYWNIGVGRAKGEVEQDEEALATMQALGRNMAWLLKKING